MKLFKRFFIATLIICSITTLGGCGIYANNKSWSDMTAEEKQEARQDFEEIKEELSEDYSGNDVADEFALYIINKVGQSFDNAD
jgi:predicted negative regulator of RcsB-dependent stress response